jgi:hypothetical protein
MIPDNYPKARQAFNLWLDNGAAPTNKNIIQRHNERIKVVNQLARKQYVSEHGNDTLFVPAAQLDMELLEHLVSFIWHAAGGQDTTDWPKNVVTICYRGELKEAWQAARKNKLLSISGARVGLPKWLQSNEKYLEALWVLLPKMFITQLKHNAHHTAGNYVQRDVLAAELIEFEKAFISCYHANVEYHAIFFETAKKILVNELGETNIPWEKING